MSVDTKGKLLGHVDENEIVKFIHDNFDRNVSSDVTIFRYSWKANEKNWIKEVYDYDGGSIYAKSGFIFFKYNGKDKALFYLYNSYNAYENLDYYSEYGLEYMVKSECTDLFLRHNDDSIEIMKEIVSYFGGFLDENDCDAEPILLCKKELINKKKEI